MTNKDQHVAILMCTHNGAAHLEAQLQSFAMQTHKDWSLWVSDDGSTDETRAMIDDFRDAHPGHRVTVVPGPCEGAAQNFLSLIHRTQVPAGLIALSDQDDVWLPHKLARAVSIVGDGDVPIAYGAQSIVGNDDLSTQRAPKNRLWPAHFGNALVQNILSGHTLVLNHAAHKILRRAGRPRQIVFHDWWIYQVMAGHGVACIVDDAEVVIYRQHAGNTLGVSRGPGAAVARAKMVINGTFGAWSAAHREALWDGRDVLGADAVEVLRVLQDETRPAGPGRVAALHRLGVRRTSRAGNALLDLAAFLGRF